MYLENSAAFSSAEKVVLGAVFASRKTYPTRGIVAGTMVETAAGWKPVECVRMGEEVYTYDGGKKPVYAISHHVFGAELQEAYPEGVFLVPGGALDNCSAFYLLPEQFVLIESVVATEVLGTPANLVAATALEGHRGIQRVMPVDLLEVIVLEFEDEEVVYTNSGTLIHCPNTKDGSAGSSGFGVRSDDQARALLTFMDTGTPWTEADQRIAA